jgi:ABC-type branched-subunit amino acid transport system ATPase component
MNRGRRGAHARASAPLSDVLADSDAALLKLDSIDFSYGHLQILSNVSLEFAAGELVAIVGPNGAGKSTLLRVMAGLEVPADGRVWMGGADITGSGPAAHLRSGIALCPANKSIFPDMTVTENLEMGGYSLGRSVLTRQTDEVIGIFPRLGERRRQAAGSLSGGEKQMLSIAKALLLEPQVLLIDELTLGLAPIIVEGLLGAIRGRNEAGTTVILVEQSLNVAASICERAAYIEKGELRFEGPTRDLLERPDLTQAVLFGGHIGEGE